MTHAEITKIAYEYRQDYEKGMTMKQIAESRAVPIHIVKGRLYSVGCKPRRRGWTNNHLRKNHWELLSLIKSGASLNAAGKAVGVSRERARQVARQHGLSERMILAQH